MPGVHRLVISAGLGNFFAVEIDNKAVREAHFVRRAIAQRDAGHK